MKDIGVQVVFCLILVGNKEEGMHPAQQYLSGTAGCALDFMTM